MKQADKERQLFREVAIKTAQRIQPKAAEIDATGEFPKELLEALGKQGLLSILLPEEYGGNSGDTTSFCLVVEEIAKVCGSSSLLILAQGIGSMPILLGGNASQKGRYLTQIAENNGLAAFALNEPEAAMEANFPKRGQKNRDPHICLTGRRDSSPTEALPNFIPSLLQPAQGRDPRGSPAL